MCIHLLTNASTLDSSATFQRAVYQIHSLGSLLPLVEWVFIFIPILFHGIIGVVIIRGGLPNYGSYKYTSNLRYTLQRASGMIAFAFIMWHVFQMHGWFHFEAWQKKDRKRCQEPFFCFFGLPDRKRCQEPFFCFFGLP
jgi:succinate dehydrogenase / fumarate reductase cytochrome b subunit